MTKDDNDLLKAGKLPRDPEEDVAPMTGAATKVQAKPLQWLSAEELTKPVAEPKYLIDKIALAPGTLAILAGQAFAGKTIVAHDMALAIASQSHASTLGGHGTANNQGPVALLDYEMGKNLTVRRIQRLCRGRGIKIEELMEARRLFVACFPDVKLTDVDAIDRLRSVIDTHGVRLVVVDSARAMMPDVDENDSAVRTYIDRLGVLADATQTAILLLHHAGKLSREQKADPRAYLRGSSGWIDAPSSAYVLTKDDGLEKTAMVFRHIKCRHRGNTTDPFRLVIEDKVTGKDGKGNTDDKEALSLRWEDWQEVYEAKAEATVKPTGRKAEAIVEVNMGLL